MTYFTYGVTSTSRTIYETPTLFPKVTFCNVNPFTTQYAYNLTRKGIFDGSNLLDAEKQKLSHDLEDFLFECWFNDKQCYASDFTWSYHQMYGNCFTFNGNETNLKKSYLIGPDYGLQLVLYVKVYESLLNITDFKDKLGAVIRVGNSSFSKFVSNGGIFVSSGFSTYIQVDREFISMLPKPYSDCEIDSDSSSRPIESEFFNFISQARFKYTQQLCFSLCLQKKHIETHNCSSIYLMGYYNVSQCKKDMDSIFEKLENNFLKETCSPDCPLECTRNLFKTSLSFNRLNGNKYISNIKNNSKLSADFVKTTIDLAAVEKSIVSVKIFYDSLSYTKTTESPQMDVVSLVASVGGNLGLFLGVSVFSLCEIVEVLIEIYFLSKK